MVAAFLRVPRSRTELKEKRKEGRKEGRKEEKCGKWVTRDKSSSSLALSSRLLRRQNTSRARDERDFLCRLRLQLLDLRVETGKKLHVCTEFGKCSIPSHLLFIHLKRVKAAVGLFLSFVRYAIVRGSCSCNLGPK